MSCETLLLPEILPEATKQLLQDVGLTPEGMDYYECTEPGKRKLVPSIHDQARRMSHEQLVAIKAANPDLLKRMTSAVNMNYPKGDGWRLSYGIGSMAVIRAFNHGLGATFENYLQQLVEKDLDTFELYLACATPLTPFDDMYDEVANGPQIPDSQNSLNKAIELISLTAAAPAFRDKLRVGAGCTYMAIAHTWKQKDAEHWDNRAKVSANLEAELQKAYERVMSDDPSKLKVPEN